MIFCHAVSTASSLHIIDTKQQNSIIVARMGFSVILLNKESLAFVCYWKFTSNSCQNIFYYNFFTFCAILLRFNLFSFLIRLSNNCNITYLLPVFNLIWYFYFENYYFQNSYCLYLSFNGPRLNINTFWKYWKYNKIKTKQNTHKATTYYSTRILNIDNYAPKKTIILYNYTIYNIHP